MKVKARVPKKLEKTYTRCVDIGESISKAICHLDVVIRVVANEEVKRRDPFPWRNLNGAVQGLQELKKKAPELGPAIVKISEDTEDLRNLIYRSPKQRLRINIKYGQVSSAMRDLRRDARNLCLDPILKSTPEGEKETS